MSANAQAKIDHEIYLEIEVLYKHWFYKKSLVNHLAKKVHEVEKGRVEAVKLNDVCSGTSPYRYTTNNAIDFGILYSCSVCF